MSYDTSAANIIYLCFRYLIKISYYLGYYTASRPDDGTDKFVVD